MRILHIGKYYHPSVGGMETVLRNLAEGLLDAGVQVRVLAAGAPGEAPRQEIRGPRTGRTGLVERAGCLGRWNSQPLAWGLPGLVRRALAEFRPDLVHLHTPNPLATGAWLVAGRRGGAGRPTLALWHHADITRQRLGRLLVNPLLRACRREAAGICVSSAALKEGSAALRPWRAKVAVIPFGIAPEPWLSIRPRRQGPFLFVGRLVRYKGVDVLLDAAADLPQARVRIVGEGPLAADLAERIRRRGLQDRVVLAGRIDGEQLAREFAEARALILPSLDRSETFGVVQLEAMAAGVPVIAADLPTGVSEVGVPERTCLLVRPGDAAALRQAMARLQDEPPLAERLGEEARARFCAEFTRDRMLARLLPWYEGLLGAAPREGP